MEFVKRRLSREQMRQRDSEIVADYENSDLTVVEICDKHGVALNTLYAALEREEKRRRRKQQIENNESNLVKRRTI